MEGEFFKIEEMYVYSRSGKGNDTEEKRRTHGVMSFTDDMAV